MSTPFATPSPMSKTTDTMVEEDLTETQVLLFRFEPAILDLIVGIIAPDTPNRITLREGIDALFSGHWQVSTWADLMVFTSGDVATALVPSEGVPKELSAPVIVKKLGYVVDYARFGTLTPATTMNDIVSAVMSSKQRATASNVPSSPARRGVQEVFDKKAVPTLDKFTGRDEDYFAWKESTINMLGTAGFGRFLTDDQMPVKHSAVGESVFYALRGAVHGGQAQSIAQGMLDETRLDPVSLWGALEEYYDTALNRANVVLFDIRRLLSIRLDPDTTATKFISDFRDCLQRLRKNNARLSEDTDTLRALLLVAIQDDDFEMVRDSIVHKPDSGVETILTEIRERETSLMMKDQASKLGGDGANSGTRYSRRVHFSSSGTQNKSGENNHSTSQKWNIPKYPDSWKAGFGGSLFKLLISWRSDAHKGKTQDKLNTEYATVVEPYTTGGAKNKGGGGKKNKFGQSADSNQGSRSSDGDGTDTNGGDGSAGQSRKRIRLQKSRRVVTERSA